MTASGATPRSASGSRISERRATMPGIHDDQRVPVAHEDDGRGGVSPM